MFDQEILASQVRADRFPFPHEGDITLAVRNTNYALEPVTSTSPCSPVQSSQPTSTRASPRSSL
jgi:hypothetical protein